MAFFRVRPLFLDLRRSEEALMPVLPDDSVSMYRPAYRAALV